MPRIAKMIPGVEIQDIRPRFECIGDNEYLCVVKSRADKMICDCNPTDAEPCGIDCINRQLFYECSPRCPCGNQCTNRQFSQHKFADVEVFQTEKKGYGLRSLRALPRYTPSHMTNACRGTFVYEYCGEVVDLDQFDQRKIVCCFDGLLCLGVRCSKSGTLLLHEPR